MASSLQKNLVSGDIASIISLVERNGCVGHWMNLFSVVKPVTRRTIFPSALGTKNAGLHHVVSLWTGVMMCLSISSCTVFFIPVQSVLGLF